MHGESTLSLSADSSLKAQRKSGFFLWTGNEVIQRVSDAFTAAGRWSSETQDNIVNAGKRVG